jgi:hypothetical protein
MKKIALFLTVMASLVVIMGCNNNRKTVTRFTPEGDTAATADSTDTAKAPETIVKVKDSEPVAVKQTPIELKADNSDKAAIEAVAKPVDNTVFDVTSLAKNLAQDTRGYQLIEGTTPASTSKILVNDYPLSRYKTGETKWSYIAAVSLGNLKKGDNPFTVKALDADGNELGSKAFTITYKGVEKAKLATTGMDSLSLSLLITLLAMGYMGFRDVARKNA